MKSKNNLFTLPDVHYKVCLKYPIKKATGILDNEDNRRAIRNHSQEQIKKTQSDSTVTLCACDFCSSAIPWKIGKNSRLWFETVPTPVLFSFWWPLSPSINPCTSVGSLTHQFYGSQLSCSSTVLREPHRTPGTGLSQNWLTADIPFQPCGVLSHRLLSHVLLLLQKTSWASECAEG